MLKCITVIWIAKYCFDARYSSTAVWISGAFQFFFEGLCVAPTKLSLLGEATPCCLLREGEGGRGREREMGGREESSSFQRNWAKSSLRCQKEDSSEHASLPASLTHFIAVGRSLNWMWVDTRAELGVFADRRLATLTLKVVSSNPRSICEKWRRETSKSNSLL